MNDRNQNVTKGWQGRLPATASTAEATSEYIIIIIITDNDLSRLTSNFRQRTARQCPTNVSTHLKHHFQPWFKAERGLESFMTRDVRGGLLTYLSLEDMADLPK